MIIALVLSTTSVAKTKNCEVNGFILKTQGKISCAEAKRIYKTYTQNHPLPKGWMCAASAKECFKEDENVRFEFRAKQHH